MLTSPYDLRGDDSQRRVQQLQKAIEGRLKVGRVTYRVEVRKDIMTHDYGKEGVRRSADEMCIVPTLAMRGDDDRRQDRPHRDEPRVDARDSAKLRALVHHEQMR